MQPFGTPVLPDVYKRTARSSFAVGSHSRYGASSQRDSTFRDGTDLVSSFSTSSHSSVSATSRLGSELSRMPLISRARIMGGVGTATAPMRNRASSVEMK